RPRHRGHTKAEFRQRSSRTEKVFSGTPSHCRSFTTSRPGHTPDSPDRAARPSTPDTTHMITDLEPAVVALEGAIATNATARGNVGSFAGKRLRVFTVCSRLAARTGCMSLPRSPSVAHRSAFREPRPDRCVLASAQPVRTGTILRSRRPARRPKLLSASMPSWTNGIGRTKIYVRGDCPPANLDAGPALRDVPVCVAG
ncbi:MAG: hypothetical protein QOE61_2831, partial [Micromonosporaceae bacterium]|nr:hypothetical protein [Micromonosporaceae bacterium]